MKGPLRQIASLGLIAALSLAAAPGENAAASPAQAPRTVVEVPPRIDPKRCPAPDYPPVSRRNKEEGRVVLDLAVNEKGGVDSIRVVEPSRFSRLRNTAEKTVSKWSLIPASRDGKPVAGSLRVAFLFRLEREGEESSPKAPSS